MAGGRRQALALRDRLDNLGGVEERPQNSQSAPLPDGDRNSRGQFVTGNPGGPGNRNFRHALEIAGRWDEAISRTCHVERMAKATEAVLTKAEGGDVAAYRAIAEYTKGPPMPYEALGRIAELEERLRRLDELLARRQA